MTHYSPEQWADFARQRLTPADETAMQDHLESGCAECVQTLQTWLGVLEVASSLNIYSPPEGGVRFVKALYHAFPPQKPGNLRLDVAHLIFPSARETALEGVRAAPSGQRHFLFQRDNVLLDIQIEPGTQEGTASVAGQVLNPVSPDAKFGGRTVTVLSENSEIARASTNQFGEFHLEFQPIEDLMLVVALEDGGLLVTPLPSLATSLAGAGSTELHPEDTDAQL